MCCCELVSYLNRTLRHGAWSLSSLPIASAGAALAADVPTEPRRAMRELPRTPGFRQIGRACPRHRASANPICSAPPIRDLRLTIDGTRLQPVIEEFRAELARCGITKVVPRFHLSTEWGVPFGTVVIGIPFYLARPELTELHGEAGRPHRRLQSRGHPALPAPRDGSRRQLRLQALRPRRVGEAVRLDHAAVSRGIPAAAVQPPLRAAPAGLVRAEASRRGLVRDVRRLDDAGLRLARRLRAAADGARQARVLRAHDRVSSASRS